MMLKFSIFVDRVPSYRNSIFVPVTLTANSDCSLILLTFQSVFGDLNIYIALSFFLRISLKSWDILNISGEKF